LSGDLFDRASEVFLSVCELAPDQRARALDTALAGDPDAPLVRGEVERLLAAEARSGTVLGESALGAFAIPGPSPPTAARAPIDAVPDEIAGHRILRRIGAGGMGVVFEAEQDQPRRRVALKLIRGALFSEQALLRFQREIELLGRIGHPGVARIFAAGSDASGNPFFTMELVQGVPLLRYVSERAPDLEARLRLFLAICDAVKHVHAAGVVHRDLKSANILVDESGAPRIVDFGIARAVVDDGDGEADGPRTLQGELVGTLAFASPEQVRGASAEVDERSDVYSLGAILYELLAERPPLDVRGLPLHEAVRRVCEDEPVPLGRLDARLSGDLETIAATALEKRKDRRYPGAGALAADVRRHLAHEPIRARPPSRGYLLAKFVQRNRSLVGAGAAVLIALLIGLTVALSQAERARDEALALRRKAYILAIRGAQSALLQSDPQTAQRMLIDAPAEERNWEWDYLDAQLNRAAASLGPEASGRIRRARFDGRGRLWTLAANGELRQRDLALAAVGAPREFELGSQFEFSPGGDSLVTLLGADPMIAASYDVETGRELGRARLPFGAHGLAVADGGRRIAAGRGEPSPVVIATTLRDGESGLERWDLAGSNKTLLAWGDRVYCGSIPLNLVRAGEPHARTSPVSFYLSVADLALDAERELLAVAAYDKRVMLLRADDLEPLHTLTSHRDEVTGVAFTRDGTTLASSSLDRTVRLWDVKRALLEATLLGGREPLVGVTFAPDGGHVAAWDRAGGLLLWDRARATDRSLVGEHDSYVYAVAYSPDGARLYSGSWDGTVRVWDARSGGPLARFEMPRIEGDAGFVSNATALAVSPDGRTLAVGVGASESMLYVVDAVTGTPRREVEARGELQRVAWSPDGSRVAFATAQRRLAVIDVATGELVFDDEVADQPVGFLAFADDSRDIDVLDVCLPYAVERIDVATGERVRRLGDLPYACGATLTADGRLLATGHPDGRIRTWDVASGALLAELTGHTSKVYALRFSPDEARLASGSKDATVRLWDPWRAEELLTLGDHSDYVYSLGYAPDGRSLASASGDGTVRKFDTRSTRARAAGAEAWAAARAARAKEVAGLLGRLGDADAVAQHLRTDPGLTPDEREAALQALLLRR